MRLYRYCLPLIEPLPRDREKRLSASGFIVAMYDEDGRVGYGELADAALGRDETPKQAEAQLREGEGGKNFAPVRWALSSAQLNLELAHKGESLAAHLGRASTPTIVLNALLDASQLDFVDKGLRYCAEGFRTLKIKVGDAPLGTEITRIRELLKMVGSNVTIRLDANASMDLPEAVELQHALKKARIEYIEEPLKNLEHLDEFFKLTGVKVALDETVVTREFERWRDHEAVSTYVLKPSRIGDVDEVFASIDLAKKAGRNFVITSTFESGIGLRTLAQFASLSQGKTLAMGLATSAYFAKDFLTPPFRPFRGQIEMASMSLSTSNILSLEENGCAFRL